MTPAQRESFVAEVLAYHSDPAEEAEARTLREAIRAVVAARQLQLAPQAAARIEACADAEILRRWLALAATASQVLDL